MAKRKRKLEPLLSWMRAKRDETECARRRTWESRCRVYTVIESVGKFSGMGTTYYALSGDEIIGRHRKRVPAERTCESHMANQPLILQYTNALHKHGLDSKATKALKSKHRADRVFKLRTQKLDTLFSMVK